MGFDQGRIQHEVIVLRVLKQCGEDFLPHASPRPARKAFVDAFPFPVALRQIAPPCATAQDPPPRVDKEPVIPATACGGSNQSADINLTAACGIALSLVMTTNSAGTVGAVLNIPPLPGPPCGVISLSTQAVVINPCGLGVPPAFGGPFVLTQAYTLNF